MHRAIGTKALRSQSQYKMMPVLSPIMEEDEFIFLTPSALSLNMFRRNSGFPGFYVSDLELNKDWHEIGDGTSTHTPDLPQQVVLPIFSRLDCSSSPCSNKGIIAKVRDKARRRLVLIYDKLSRSLKRYQRAK